MEINERLKYLRKELLRLTMEQFGERLDLAKSSIGNIENGNREITDRNIKSICREFGVREEWLKTGDGEPFGPQTRNQKILAFANKVMAEEDDSIKKKLVDALADLSEDEWELLAKIADRIVNKG